MAELSPKKSQARSNAKHRSKRVGAYDNLRAASNWVQPAKKKRWRRVTKKARKSRW